MRSTPSLPLPSRASAPVEHVGSDLIDATESCPWRTKPRWTRQVWRPVPLDALHRSVIEDGERPHRRHGKHVPDGRAADGTRRSGGHLSTTTFSSKGVGPHRLVRASSSLHKTRAMRSCSSERPLLSRNPRPLSFATACTIPEGPITWWTSTLSRRCGGSRWPRIQHLTGRTLDFHVLGVEHHALFPNQVRC